MTMEFLITSIIVILLPGTGVIYTLAIGLGSGFTRSVAAAAGCTLGILPAALASILGLAAILHTSALAFQVIKYLGVIYLFYMAWSVLKQNGAMDVKPEEQKVSLFKIAINGTLLNVLNPKLSFFFMAFLPQFLSPTGGSNLNQMLLLAGIFMALTFVVFVGYGACASLARQYIISSPKVMKWLKRTFAASFAALGLKLALSER